MTGRTKLLSRTIGRVHPCYHEPVGSFDEPAEGAPLTGGAADLRGWAIDRDSAVGSGIAAVDLYLDGCPGDGTQIGRAAYGQPTPGIARYFSSPLLSESGWSFHWLTGSVSPGPHTVYAVMRSGVHPQSTTMVRTFAGRREGVVGCFDEPAGGNVVKDEIVTLSGWAIDLHELGQTAATNVTIVLEDAPGKVLTLGVAASGKERPDVALYPASGTAGWTYVWDTVGVERGRHTLKALVAAPSGKVVTFSRTIQLAPIPERNIARRRPASASTEWRGFPASLAFDGDDKTAWNSGDFAPQWIEVDLGRSTTLSHIRLIPAQSPAGRTVHRILGRAANGSYRELAHLEGWTADGQAFEWRPPEPVPSIQFIRVETVESPSWIAWSEIEVYPAVTPDASHTRIVGTLLLASGTPAAGICVQLGGPCLTETNAEGLFVLDFDRSSLADVDWTFVYVIEGVTHGSQRLPRGTATGDSYNLPTYTLRG